VRKGANGRLRDDLSLKHTVPYERRAGAKLSQEYAGQLLTGDLW
jgi:hypothetical protein